MIFILAFSVLLISSCFLLAFFAAQLNLNRLNLKIGLAFSSGLLISLCILDFLPHSFEWIADSVEGSKLFENSQPFDVHSAISLTAVFIFTGILLQALADIYLLPYLSFLDRLLKIESQPKYQHSHTFSSLSVCSVAGCLSICSFFDGIRLWTAFQTEFFTAFSTAFGLFFHLLSEGVLIAGLAISSGFKKRILFLLLALLGGVLVLGAVTAQFFSYGLSFHHVMAFSTGCLLYICFVHLLPVSLKDGLRYWFFMGLVAFSALHFVFEAGSHH